MIKFSPEEIISFFDLVSRYRGLSVVIETSGGLLCSIEYYVKYEYYYVRTHGFLMSVLLRGNGSIRRFTTRIPDESDLVLFSLESMLT